MILPALDPVRARTLVTAFQGLPILVVGDVMLDRFVVGTVARISPEAPVPVVRFRSEHTSLGGAANVAHNLVTLGARVSLVGVVGNDAPGGAVRRDLAALGISADGLVMDPSRPTTEKVRIVTERNQQVARVDYEEEADLSPASERLVIERIERLATDHRALLVSDYLKGTITKRVMGTLIARTTAGTPLLVDPKVPHIDCYAGATVITPNHHEAETATGRRIRSDDDARISANELRARARCAAALVTRGEHGMWLSCEDVEGPILAAAREVADVTGAGDTVVAVLALGLAAGGTLVEAARLANYAAGIVVAKFGPATVTPAELLATLS